MRTPDDGGPSNRRVMLPEGDRRRNRPAPIGQDNRSKSRQRLPAPTGAARSGPIEAILASIGVQSMFRSGRAELIDENPLHGKTRAKAEAATDAAGD